jgi:hypothetical protein
MSPGSSKAAPRKKRGEAQKKARQAQMRKQKLQQEDDYDSAEKGTTASLLELQGDAIGYLQTGQLNVCQYPFLPFNPAYLG